MKFTAKDFQRRLPNKGAGEGVGEYDFEDRGIVLLPVFRSRRLTSFDDVIMKSAVWAWRSWLCHTDAVEHGVSVKFHVETAVYDRFAKYLQQHSIDPDRWTEELDIGNHKVTDLGKFAMFYEDTKFDGYDFVLAADADLFCAKPTEKKMNFFERFFANDEIASMSIACMHAHKTSGMSVSWVHEFCKYGNTEEQFHEAISNLSDGTFDYEDRFGVRGILHAYRSGSLSIEDRQFLVECCRVLCNDEVGISVFAQVADVEILSLFRALDVHHVSDIMNFDKYSRGTDPYFTHFNTSHEMRWRDQIGVVA